MSDNTNNNGGNCRPPEVENKKPDTTKISDFFCALLPKGLPTGSPSAPTRDLSGPQRSEFRHLATGILPPVTILEKIPAEVMRISSAFSSPVKMEASVSRERQIVWGDQQGTIELNTGDKLLRAAKQETLGLKEGGTLRVHENGSFELSGQVIGQIKHDAKSGRTTLLLNGHGDEITLTDGKIEKICRGAKEAKFLTACDLEANSSPQLAPSQDKIGPLPPTLLPNESKFR